MSQGCPQGVGRHTPYGRDAHYEHKLSRSCSGAAIVTGSTGGIGLAIAKGLADAGATVVIYGREQERVDAALAQLRTTRAGAQARVVVADLGTAAGCQALLDAEPDADILMNKVGIYSVKAFFDIDDADWEAFFQVNVMSGVRLARHYAQGMKARGWGRIQFISSESALNIPAEMVHYGVSKAALQGLSRGLAKVLAGSGVTVNTILPGPTRTEGAIAFIAGMAQRRNAGSPRRRWRPCSSPKTVRRA